MNYLDYLKSVFPQIEITEESNYSYKGEKTVIVIKYLGGGQNYRDSVIQPVQLCFYTPDNDSAMTLAKSFSKNYTNIPFTQKTEYIIQYYSTPTTITQLQMYGNNYNSQVIVNGTLIISNNVSEIAKVEIDGFEVETTRRKISYSGVADNQRSNQKEINSTEIKSASLFFSCDMINKNNDIGIKARRIRKGTLKKNTTFNIKLTYTDNNFVEEYSMKLHDFTLDSNNQSVPVLALVFIE